MRQFLAVTALIALLGFVACSRSSSDQPGSNQPPASQPPAANAPAGTNPNGGCATTSSAPGATTSEPAYREITIPANTLLHVRLETLVASDTSRVEDPVHAAVTKAVFVRGVEAVPAGSVVKGVVTEARRSGKVKGRAQIAFKFDELSLPDGGQHRVQTRTVALQAPSTRRNDAVKIGAPAAGGAILGALLGGKKGAAIGAAAGGGAGTAVVLTTRGKEVRLARGTALTVKLLEPVTVQVAGDR